MLRWMRRGLGERSGAGMNAVVGALDAVYNPGAMRAREYLEQQHQRVVPIPSPGDRLLDERRVVVARRTVRDE